MKGGYIMIDCTGLDLITAGSTAQTINGLYNRVQTAMKRNKPLYAYNAKWDGKAISPIQTFAIQLEANTIVCTSSTLQIWIGNDDSVEVHNMIGG